MSRDEAALLEWLNRERASAGVPPLVSDPTLVNLARRKARDILDNGYFSHTSPTLGTPAQMVRAAGLRYRFVGENIAKARDAYRAHQMFLASPDHRANLTNPSYEAVGIGVVANRPAGVIVVELFAGR
ncbi:MAG: hypothetical protein IRY95_04975 [Clostridia bacterium]|nr:hypothetical protein [Clostridia bacterium]